MIPAHSSSLTGLPAGAGGPGTAGAGALTIHVSELFLSIQGEGPSAGMPAHFLRLQGCSVGCHWCDSKYTWEAAGGRALVIDAAFDELAALGHASLLVITGGEP